MSKKPETHLQKRIQHALRDRWPDSYIIKIHGGPFQQAGIPDLLACIKGLFIAIEVKTPTGKTSKIQDETLLDIANAQACAVVASSVEQALHFVTEHIRKNDYGILATTATSEASSGVRRKRKVRRSVLQAKARKDLDRSRYD